MTLRLTLFTLLAAAVLFLDVCAARSVPLLSRDLRSARRVHDSGSGSSSSSDSTYDSTSTTSSTTTNNNDNNNDDETSTTSTSDRCLGQKNVTRNSTSGGITPDGSGTAPRFDNRTGAFIFLFDDAANDVDINDQHYLSYLGGAAIPFKSGDDSPNGVAPKKLDNLAFATVDEESVKDGSCAVPNTSYAYEYQSKYSLSSGSVPVYCVCDPLGLCGCDDHHGNSSFVDVMLAYVGLDTEAKNVSKACTISLDRATAILVDGGLSNGSTKADPDADEVLARESRTRNRKCGGSGNGNGGDGTGAATALSVNGWLIGSVLGMVLIVWF
ncbi:uncharacterized protein BDV14DRAFT_211226 [Aspergillus stella-maris]|uniref:uncharacterized protein n=1 Tax=Aspergillus stella-maris TaxID=1810926 RepID=UPI003CCDDF15